MSKLGWAVLALITIALVAYVAWPEASDPASEERLLPDRATPPGRFHLHADGLDQEAADGTVVVHGLTRPLDHDRVQELWNTLQSIAAPESAIARQVTADELPEGGHALAWSSLAAPGLDLRWGMSGSTAEIWDALGARLFVLDHATMARLARASGRLDLPVLLDVHDLRQVRMDGITAVPDGLEWIDEAHPARPPYTRRCDHLRSLLRAQAFSDADRTLPVAAVPVGTLTVTTGAPQAGSHVLSIDRDPATGTGWLVCDQAPPQRLSAELLAGWRQLIAAWPHDYLVNIERYVAVNPLSEVVVERAGQLLFRLEKLGMVDAEMGISTWDVVWPHGREAAERSAAGALAQACDDLACRDAVPRQPGEAIPADAVTFDFVFQSSQRHVEVAIAGTQVWSERMRATALSVPARLAEPRIEDQLDRALTTRVEERATRFQRIIHDPPPGSAELFVSDDGRWRQAYPRVGPGHEVDQEAVDRLVRAICSARARSVRLLQSADLAMLRDPALEIDLRFSPGVSSESTDSQRLEDTTDADVSFVFHRDGAAWRAIEADGGVSYLVDDRLVDALRLPVTADLVLPTLPSLITRLVVTPVVLPSASPASANPAASGPGAYALTWDGSAWTICQLRPDGSDGAQLAADQLAVRRYLRTLCTLRADHWQASAAPLAGAEIAASIQVFLPYRQSWETLTLSIGRASGLMVPLHLDSNRIDSHQAPGRAFILRTQLAELLPPWTAFAHAAPASATAPAPAARPARPAAPVAAPAAAPSRP